jgi:hypothetical protein
VKLATATDLSGVDVMKTEEDMLPKNQAVDD